MLSIVVLYRHNLLFLLLVSLRALLFMVADCSHDLAACLLLVCMSYAVVQDRPHSCHTCLELLDTVFGSMCFRLLQPPSPTLQVISLVVTLT